MKLVAPLRVGPRILLKQAMAHRVYEQILAEVEGEARELPVQPVNAFEVDALVEWVVQQAVDVDSIVQQLAEQVSPLHEEWVGGPRCQEPTLDEVLMSMLLLAIERVEEDAGRLFTRRDRAPTQVVQVGHHQDRYVHVNPTVASKQCKANGVGRRLVRLHVHEPVRQFGLGQELKDRVLVQHANVPMWVVALPGVNAQLEELGHGIVPLCPIGPNGPVAHLASQAPAWRRVTLVHRFNAGAQRPQKTIAGGGTNAPELHPHDAA
mmetsp:Transcript_73474/g.204118  ORF Transcript_73474/g.204118 Transcript_73474/m.204118 type:complete len:264 (+) Transcript_73474:592-1383(+)